MSLYNMINEKLFSFRNFFTRDLMPSSSSTTTAAQGIVPLAPVTTTPRMAADPQGDAAEPSEAPPCRRQQLRAGCWMPQSSCGKSVACKRV